MTALARAYAEGVRPDAVLTVSAWADTHRKLPKKSSAEPGPWRTDRTPYLREIMDCLSSTSPVEEVVFMKASQIGGTECILNALGYAIDHAPAPTILVQPTVDLAKRFSRQRVDPMIQVTPQLAAKVAVSRSREGGNSLLSKEAPGMVLIITGANSAVGLRSMPAQYAFLDEIDGYPIDVDDEGSPIDLVEARQRTFARRKRLKVSTPTIEGRSAIQAAYAATDQRRFYVPCPDCGEMQPLEFPRLKWRALDLPPERAVYECRACFHRIENHQKTAMLARGVWVPERADATALVRGYHLNALYSPVGWMSWGEIATAFVAAHKTAEKLRVFTNTVLGEVWAEKGEAPEWRRLYDRRESYAVGTVPAGVLFLTAAADVQHDRILVEVVGWGRGKTSWSIEWEHLRGSTDDIEEGAWRQLTAFLERTYTHASGAEMTIDVLAVDSGDQTQTVYSWTRRHPISRVIAVKGVSQGGMLLGSPSTVDVTVRGRKLKGGARVWPVAVNLAKSELYGWLRLERPTDEAVALGAPEPAGYCHFPQYPEAYFEELTSEQIVVTKNRRGYIVRSWSVIPGRQNHTLDARVYNRAAAAYVGIDRFRERDWRRYTQRLGMPDEAAPAPVAAPEASPAPAVTPVPPRRSRRWFSNRRGGGWLKGSR